MFKITERYLCRIFPLTIAAHSEIMASNSSKRPKPATPEKGVDKCAVSGCVLSESSPAIQCDECDKWLCATCLGMSTAEYNIFCKMNERLGSIWTCPLCKTGSSKPDVPNIVKSTLNIPL